MEPTATDILAEQALAAQVAVGEASKDFDGLRGLRPAEAIHYLHRQLMRKKRQQAAKRRKLRI
jgi:hypothetical protein